MTTPFTAEQFFDVFRNYNTAVWPAQIALLVVGICCAAAAYRASIKSSWRWGQVALVLLSLLWLWTAFVYHRMFFVTISPAGRVFGSLFVAEAGLLLLCVWQNGSMSLPSSHSHAAMTVGTLLLLYALAIYPLVGSVTGHHYPAAPTFGTPCPTTIFTFGIFCLLPGSIPRFALAIPVVWAVIGSYAAFGFGVHEDLGLIVAALATIVVIHQATHRRISTRVAV